MSGKILVTGAPGNVGSEVVKGLIAASANFAIGAFDVERAREAFGEAVEMHHFDFLQPETYTDAFAGIDRLFLVRPPALSNVKRDIAPALHAAQAASITQIVFLSLQGVENNKVVPHYKIEQEILSMDIAYTFLRCSFFMQNLSTTHRDEIRDSSEIAVPVGRARTSFIDVRDIAAVAVRALTETGHENRAYTLTGGEALDYEAVAQMLSRELGRTIRYSNPSTITFLVRQIERGTALSYALVVTALYTITRMGNAKQVTTDVRDLLGREPIRFDQFAHDYRASWVMSMP